MRTVFLIVSFLWLAAPAFALDCDLDVSGSLMPTQADVDILATRVVADDLTVCGNGCDFDRSGGGPDVGDVAALLKVAQNGTDPGGVCAMTLPVVTYLRSCGSFGTGEAQLRSPRGVAIISDSIYVADGNNDRVSIWDFDCNHLGNIGPTLTQGVTLSVPEGICKAMSGDLWALVDKGHSRVIELSGSSPLSFFGSAGASSGQFDDPMGCVYLSNGDIVVADRTSVVGVTAHNRVQVFDAQRSPSLVFGQTGTSLGQFGGPVGVMALSGGDYLVVDPVNGNAQRVRPDGTGRYYIGAAGSGDAKLATPSYVVSDEQQRYFYTSADARIKVFTAAGVSLGGFGGVELDYPLGIAYHQGRKVLVVSDKDKHQIVLYRLE